MTMNVLTTNAKFSDSTRALAQHLALTYAAAILRGPDSEQYEGTHEEGRAIHAELSRGALSNEFMDSTGGNIWVGYCVHVDAATGARVLFQYGCDSSCAYVLPPEDYARADAGDLYALSWDIECERTGDNAAGALRVIDGGYLESSRDCVNACGQKFWQAAESLELETVRVFDAVLDDEQRDALRDASQAFGMLDDMEARMGLNVDTARALVTDAHSILHTLPAKDAAGIHETTLAIEYAQKMARPRELGGFGLATFGSAEEVQAEHAADSAVWEWCERFTERWNNDGHGIDAPYNGEREEEEEDEGDEFVAEDEPAPMPAQTDAERAAINRNACAECERMREENAALREAYAAIHDATYALRAAVADANDALRAAGVR
jgi:hypothetical protein